MIKFKTPSILLALYYYNTVVLLLLTRTSPLPLKPLFGYAVMFITYMDLFPA